jgi:hypothetical protein
MVLQEGKHLQLKTAEKTEIKFQHFEEIKQLTLEGEFVESKGAMPQDEGIGPSFVSLVKRCTNLLSSPVGQSWSLVLDGSSKPV